MSKICLTKNQQVAFNAIKEFHKENGRFPNRAQLATALKRAGIGSSPSNVSNIYGALLLKGAFTNGTILTDSVFAAHSGGNITPLDISKLDFNVRRISTGPVRQQTTANTDAIRTGIANAIIQLLKQDKNLADTFGVVLNG